MSVSVASSLLRVTGEIFSCSGASITATLPQASVGDMCWIHSRCGKRIAAQIVGFQESNFALAPLSEPAGIYPGAIVETYGQSTTIPVGIALLGKVINAFGEPLDDVGAPIGTLHRMALSGKPPRAMDRPIVNTPLTTGIRGIDGFCTIGLGQRIGIFASAGVGKSTLLGMLARRSQVDIIVVALVGERGREVREFVECTLGTEGLRRSVVVVATSDEPSLVRQMAPYAATAIAEFFRDQGKNVLLIVDSLTRMARAIRETSLSAGELPVRHGYTNSVYTELPKLLERAGSNCHGTITAVYTVLTNEDDDIDPLADEVKSLIDGHLVLNKSLSLRGVFPALDITKSISRVFNRLHGHDYLNASREVTRAMERLMREKDLALLGGTPDQELANILAMEEDFYALIRQNERHEPSLEESKKAVLCLARMLEK